MIVRLLKYGLAILLLCMCACEQQSKKLTPPMAQKGVLDLTDWDFERDGPIDLTGEYEFYWNQLLYPQDLIQDHASLKTEFIAVPRAWNDFEFQGKAIPGDGYATYCLKVILKKRNIDLAVKLLEMSTSYNLFVNGRKVSSAGVVGKSADSAKPGFRPGVIGFHSSEGLLDIVVQISNFSHGRGGARETISLGTSDQLHENKELKIAYDLFLFGSILIMALYHLGLFSLRRKERSTLYFGLFCLLIALRILTAGEKYLLLFFPGIGYETAIKLEYLAFYAAVPVFVQYFYSLFCDRFSKTIRMLSTGIGLAFCALVILSPVKFFSNTLSIYQIFTLTMFIYAIAVLTLASLKKEFKVIIFLAGFAMLFLLSVNDMLYSQNIIQSRYMVQIGLFLFIFSQAYLLSRNFSNAFSTVEIQGEKLRKINQRFMSEIKERRRAERSLKESHERFLNLLDGIHADVYVADMNTYEILFMNQHMRETFGADFVGDICWKAFRNESEPCRQCTNERLINADGTVNPVYVWERQNPITGKWYLNYDRAVKWDGDRFVRLQIATDVTDRKLAEVTLRKAKDELEVRVALRTTEILKANEALRQEIEERKQAQRAAQKAKMAAEIANRTKSEFLANMSHELRTPLNHIIGFTELILDNNFGELNETQSEYLNDVHTSSVHLLSLINDILDLSKVEAGKLEYNPKKIPIRKILTNSLIMIKEKAMKRNIKISNNLDGIPESIYADERKLKQILYNLLSNAIKFTPDGGSIELVAKRASDGDIHGQNAGIISKGYIEVSVKDNGVGLKIQDLDRIFHPFEQVDSSISRKFQGTGLGLSLTKSLVELHGGKIWADSQGENQGSTFSFCIPVDSQQSC